MARSLWEVFVSLFERNRGEDDEASDRFVPSPLDVSVRVAHGGSDDEIERELDKIDEQARALERNQRDRRDT